MAWVGIVVVLASLRGRTANVTPFLPFTFPAEPHKSSGSSKKHPKACSSDQLRAEMCGPETSKLDETRMTAGPAAGSAVRHRNAALTAKRQNTRATW